MKKDYIPTFLIIILLIFCLIYFYLSYNKEEETKSLKEVKVVPTLISKLENNSIWCASFQLIWNDLKNEIIKNEIVFVDDENNPMVLDLNKETITTNNISDNYYYKKHGYMTLDLKHEIENGIKNKFNEKSDILDSMNFQPNSQNYLLYAMLYRKFEFVNPFDILNDETFGISNTSDKILDNNVKVLYFDGDNNYAVKIKTKDDDEVILVKGKNNKSNFLEIYNELNDNETNFLEEDTISISKFNFKLKTNFKELEHKQIKDSDYTITSALQTINFSLDNQGGKVKSEAAITFKNAISNEGRHFDFTDNYVLFLKEKIKDKPYFAMKIDNIEKFK